MKQYLDTLESYDLMHVMSISFLFHFFFAEKQLEIPVYLHPINSESRLVEGVEKWIKF